ncbi:response regulator [Haloarculaceae archaeon H-GB11]|nr:response regulator [Haloarculaceae archaeon H-GB11]
MDESIRVLHVDDEPGFAEMAATFLEREQDRFTVDAVTSAGEALDRIDAAAFDCVVSDYDMPEMDGLELLDAVRERYPELPFVLFTGKGSEEIASEAISHGVTDYLQKETGTDQYTVLANRVENAVTQFRAEQAVEETQERFTKLVEHSTDIVSVIAPDGTYEYVAPSVKRVLGYEASELQGTNALDLVHSEDRELAVTKLSEVAASPESERTADLRVQQANGEYCILEVKARNLLDVSAVEGIVLNIRDITERVELEERLRRNVDWLRRLYEASSNPELDFATRLERILELGTERLGLPNGTVTKIGPDGDTLTIVATATEQEGSSREPNSRCREPSVNGR